MPRSRQRERVPLPPGFGALWSTVALDLLGWGIVLPILPLFAERFDASPTQIGLLVASFSLAQFVCSPVLGRLSDRVGRKPVILVSLVGTALGAFLTAAAPALWMVFLGRIVDGASGASVSVAQGAVADISAPPERPRLYGLLGAAFGVGFVLGPALGGLAALVGPRVPFVVAGVLALVNAGVAFRRLPETHPSSRVVGPENLQRIAPQPAGASAPALTREDSPDVVGPENLRRIPGPTGPDKQVVAEGPGGPGNTQPEKVPVAGAHATRAGRPPSGLLGPTRAAGLLRFAVIGFVATAAFAGFEATFSLFGERRFDLTEGSVAGVFVLIGLLLVAVQGGLVRPVTERFGLHTTLLGGLALTSIGLLVLAPARTWPVLLLALALLVLGQGLASPTLTSEVAERAPEDVRGQLLGVQQSAGALARIAGPIAAGVLFDRIGVGAPALVGAALVGLALMLATTVRPLAARPTATTAATSTSTSTSTS